MRGKLIFFVIIGLALLLVLVMIPLSFFLANRDPVELTVLYSTEKEAWLEAAVENFEGDVEGRPIVVNLEKMGSREMVQAIVAGEQQPDLVSPASSLQASLLETESRARFGRPLVDPDRCRPVVSTPLVLLAWPERAEALWGDAPGQNLWLELQTALVDPKGWASYGHPEWGYVKFGHTDPTRSNSGLMTILLLAYGYFEKTGDLSLAEVRDTPEFRDWFTRLEDTIATFGSSTGTYGRDIVTYGPSKYDLIAVYESTAIEQAQNATGRYGQLQVYYPPATVLSDHPFCTVTADWVTPERGTAAKEFTDYLLSPEVQAQALALGFRPADPGLALDQPGSPFMTYAANGIQTQLPPEVEVPPGEVLDVLLGIWCTAVGPNKCPPGSF